MLGGLPPEPHAQAPPTDPAQKAPTNQNIQPGTGGVSKAGKDGLPEGKSGPAAKPDASVSTMAAPSANEGASTGTGGSDDSGVPGDAGGKAGPAAK